MSTDACVNKYEPWHAVKHKPLAGATRAKFPKKPTFSSTLGLLVMVGDGGGKKVGDDDSGGWFFQEGLEIGGQEGLDRASVEAHSGGG